MKTSRGWTILHLEEALDKRLPELDEVRERVEADLKQEKMEAASLGRLEQVRAQLASGEGALDQAAEELGLEVKESNEFGRNTAISGLGQNPEIVKAVLASEAGAIGGPIKTQGGAVLFEVLERKKFDPAAYEDAKADKRQDLRDERLNQLRSALIEMRRRDLEPQYDSRVLENFGIDGQELG